MLVTDVWEGLTELRNGEAPSNEQRWETFATSRPEGSDVLLILTLKNPHHALD